MTSMRPVPAMYPVSQVFAGTFSTQFSGSGVHGAVDFATPTGTPVVAPDDGVIVHADWAWNLPGGPNDWAPRWYQLKPAVGDTRGGGGIMTVLRNDAGSHWLFAHLSSNDEAPKGRRVKRGDIIGKTGNTGTSTGAHLHLSLIPPNPVYTSYSWGAIDPLPWLTIPFQPNTYTAWQGSPTAGKGSATTGAGSATAKTVQPAVYRLVRSHTSKNYTAANQVPAVYGVARKITGVTVHWWGDPATAGTHASVAAYLSRAGGDTSAHAVVSKGLVEEIVPLQHAAWHAGSAKGNAETIGIECDPRDVEGTLPTLVAYLRDLEKAYGSLRVYGHRDWSATACPGDYYQHIDRIVASVNAPATTTIKPKEWDEMATKAEIQAAVRDTVRAVVREEIAKNNAAVASAVHTRRVTNAGAHPVTGAPLTGTTTLEHELRHAYLHALRRRTVFETVAAIAEAVRPSTLAAILRGTTKTEES